MTFDQAKAELKNIEKTLIGLEKKNNKTMTFDHYELYKFFGCVFKELESLKKTRGSVKSTDNKKPLTKAEIDLEIKQNYEWLKNPPFRTARKRALYLQEIKKKINILKNMRETIDD